MTCRERFLEDYRLVMERTPLNTLMERTAPHGARVKRQAKGSPLEEADPWIAVLLGGFQHRLIGLPDGGGYGGRPEH